MSNPTWPVYTFRVNLQTLQRYTWLQPTNTAAEADQLKNTRSSFLASLLNGFENIVKIDADTFTAYGLRAKYLKDLYVTGSIDDVLQLVS